VADRLEEIQILFQVRNARKRGPSSSDQFNDSVNELAHDLTAFNTQWNDRLVPLTTSLPDGTEGTSPVDAFTDGLDGTTIYSDADATSTTNSQYYNSSAARPYTLWEQLDDLYTSIDNAVESLEAQIGSNDLAASQISIADDGSIYIASNVEDALQEVMTQLNVVQLLDFGSVGEGIFPSQDNSYDIGSVALRWKDGYFGPGSLNIVSKTTDGGSHVDRTYSIKILDTDNKLKFYEGTTAVLGLDSTNGVSVEVGAFLAPRLSTTERDALSAINGMIIYNITVSGFQGYEQDAWVNLV
jgi:hypothetical protein